MAKSSCTLKDVAKACGVSAYTVSRALNDKPDISKSTREHIVQKAREMGYVVNTAAKNLRAGETKTVGLVYDDFENPFYSILIKKIAELLYEKGYDTTLFYDFESISMLNTHFLKRVLASNVCAIISLIPLTDHAVEFNELWNRPLVQVGAPSQSQKLDCLYLDDPSGGRLVTEELIKKGFKRIGFINASEVMVPGLRRLEGYRNTLKAHGLPVIEDDIIQLSESGLKVPEAVNLLLIHQCDAIICFNDMTAFDVFRHLRSIDRNDVAVAGFDGISRHLPWPDDVITLYSDLDLISKKAVEILLKRLNGEKLPRQSIMFPFYSNR